MNVKIYTSYYQFIKRQVVDHLDNLEEVVPLLKELGGRHGATGYNINPKFFPVSCVQSCCCTLIFIL